MVGDSNASVGFKPVRCASKCHITTFVPAMTVSDAFPLIPLSDAVTVVESAVAPVARPVEFMVATAGVVAAQVAVELTFAVEPLL